MGVLQLSQSLYFSRLLSVELVSGSVQHPLKVLCFDYGFLGNVKKKMLKCELSEKFGLRVFIKSDYY